MKSETFIGHITGYHNGKIVITLDSTRSLLKELFLEEDQFDCKEPGIGLRVVIYETFYGYRASIIC